MVFTFNVVGFYFVFEIDQHYVRTEINHRIKKEMSDKELTDITTAANENNELNWKNEKEFWYKGLMYDVVKKSTSEGITHYYCITDREETTLFANLDEFVKQNSDTQNKENSSAKNLSKLLCNPFIPSQQLIHSFSASSLLPQRATTDNYFSPVIDITGPPPKVIS